MAFDTNLEQAEYGEVPFVPSASVRAREAMATLGVGAIDEAKPNYLMRAIAGGLVGAAIGAVIYAVFVGVTGIRIGYLSILVAYLVAKGMTIGSGDRGGREYQITALVLTYLAVAFAHSILLWWFAHLQEPVVFNASTILGLVQYGLLFPVYQLIASPGRGLLRIFILFIGLRAAWRMTSGIPGVMRHPFKR